MQVENLIVSGALAHGAVRVGARLSGRAGDEVRGTPPVLNDDEVRGTPPVRNDDEVARRIGAAAARGPQAPGRIVVAGVAPRQHHIPDEEPGELTPHLRLYSDTAFAITVPCA